MKNGNMNGHMLVSNNCIFSIANAKADCFLFLATVIGISVEVTVMPSSKIQLGIFC